VNGLIPEDAGHPQPPLIQIMLIGDTYAGKTCLLTRFKDNKFLDSNFISTVGIDYKNKIVDLDGTKVKLQLWDTAGQERFRSLTHAYFRDANAVMVVFDVTSQKSFENCRSWLNDIKEHAQEDVLCVIVGNKIDLSAARKVKREDAEKLANDFEISYFETSAKTGLHVNETFTTVARVIMLQRIRKPPPRGSTADGAVKLSNAPPQKGWCCR